MSTYLDFVITITLMTNEQLRPLLHDLGSGCWADSHCCAESAVEKEIISKTVAKGKQDVQPGTGDSRPQTTRVGPAKLPTLDNRTKFADPSPNTKERNRNETAVEYLIGRRMREIKPDIKTYRSCGSWKRQQEGRARLPDH